MSEPYYEDDTITLHHGDSLEVARTLPDGSVDCIVTSPPYYGLRDYGSDGQYGAEPTLAAYVETMRNLFCELRRVLADDGTLWLNLGDSYNKLKQLQGVPWRVAFALQEDWWVLRNDIIWHKPNAMPESVTDRLTCRYEHFFMFSNSRKYHFDLDPIREELIYPDAADGSRVFGGKNKAADLQTGSSARRTGNAYGGKYSPEDKARPADGQRHTGGHARGKNPGDMWSINTQPFPGAHSAVMPQELARRAIVAGCKPGGTVLDPFSGSGTTGLVAQNNGRKYVGIDLSADYLKLSLETRLQNSALDFGVSA